MNDSVISSDNVYPLMMNIIVITDTDSWMTVLSVVIMYIHCIIVITDRWMTVLSVVIMYIHCIIVITDRWMTVLSVVITVYPLYYSDNW